ncbi:MULTISPECIES: IclR family transcriptional regulator [Pigmentiphaga]
MNGDTGTASRLLAVLRVLVEGKQEISVKRLSEILGLPTSTTHRLLHQLVQLGFAERAPMRRYCVGREFSRLGALAMQGQPSLEVARPIMRDVVEGCNETCLLGLYLPASRQMSFVEKVDSRHPLRYRVRMYELRSLAWGASGKAILTWLPGAVVESVINRVTASPATGFAPPSVAVIMRELRRIRERGYAISKGEQTPGAVGLAAPVFGESGQVFGDLCITVPEFRFSPKDERHLAELIVTRANKLSELLRAPCMNRVAF